jgi:hypothetical protein
MDYKPAMHIVSFNDRVRAMNQTRTADIRLSAVEANNLQADITNMLAEIARLSVQNSGNTEQIVQLSVDGGSFS